MACFGKKLPGDSPRGGKKKQACPLLLHFDVNKTIILSDSIQMMTIEEGVREGIAELFWGHTQKDASGNLVWEWTKTKPSCPPPEGVTDRGLLMTYTAYCKEVIKDKKTRKEAVKSFSHVRSRDTVDEMEKLCQVVISKMQLPADVRGTREALEAGLKGQVLVMFPSVFHLVAGLQQCQRTFGILFRSFGEDHMKIKQEWNAFCEMRHPVFSHLLKGVGPLDGSQPGVPDRRIHAIHTLYRDSQGPMLLIDTFTNGPEDAKWDDWAKTKPKPATDERNGREYIKKVLKAPSVEGMSALQKWMRSHLMNQKTGAIKDDWAWWTWSGEASNAGKLMTLLGGREETKQIFFDDNIEFHESRIVDCRDASGAAMELKKSLGKHIVKVNPVEALMDEAYFLRQVQICQGEEIDKTSASASVVQFQQKLSEVEQQKLALDARVKALNTQLQALTEENRKMKLARRINVRDEAQLRDLLAKEFDLQSFGKGHKRVEDLFNELEEEYSWLEQDPQGHLVRIIDMLFLKIQYKDLILIESYEQDSDGVIQSRNYLPGVIKSLKHKTFAEVQERFFESGLQVDIRSCIKDDLHVQPVYYPDAPNQQTGLTQAFPIPCKVQQSLAHYRIIDKDKDVEANKELLGKIGLPGSKHFTTQEIDIYGSKVTRFWRWDKVATWEATTANKSVTAKGKSLDVDKTIKKLFGGHPRQEVYETLLLQMFENFTASKLCGGFSGSVVIRVQPFESDGTASEPCIVKLDAGPAIREEFINSRNVFNALPESAARIIGDAVYTHNQENKEFGAMVLELAGACWNVPELAQRSTNLLSTFKDLLVYESEQVLLGDTASDNDARPFGNVNSVLAETFGPGGIVSSLRKGGNSGKGLRRTEDTPLLWGWYTLKGKATKFNPFTEKADVYPPGPPMRRLYKKYFGVDMPDITELVVNKIKPKLEALSMKSGKELMPFIGLAHGDLNAANIMIDALDAVWLIDFATSVDLPLFTDMCKFEMAGLFEYASIPITPQLLVEFASKKEEMWEKMNVGDWLRVDKAVIFAVLKKLSDLPDNKLSSMSQDELDKLIEDVASKSNIDKPHKQRQVARALKARLVASEAYTDRAFHYCAQCSNILLRGDYLFESLDIRAPPQPDGPGAAGVSSLAFFMGISVSIRRFMLQDISTVLRDHEDLQPVDALSLSLWLPFLRESFRIVGYRDISPQQKIWSIYHCNIVAQNVLKMIGILESNWKNLRALPMLEQLKTSLEKHKLKPVSTASRHGTQSWRSEARGRHVTGYNEAESVWLYAHKDLFPQPSQPPSQSERLLRKAHMQCPLYSRCPGFFAPIWTVMLGDRTLPLNFDQDPVGAWDIVLAVGDDDESQSDIVLGRMTLNAKTHPLGPNDADNQSESQASRVTKVPTSSVFPGRRSSAADSKPEKTPSDLPQPATSVSLKSRLLVLTSEIIKAKDPDLTGTDETCQLGERFNFQEWARGMEENPLKFDMSHSYSLRSRPGQYADRPRRHSRTTRNSAHNAKGAEPDPSQFIRFMLLECVARDDEGRDKCKLMLEIGIPGSCYPPGSIVCRDPNFIGQSGSSTEMVIVGTDETVGSYIARDVYDPSASTEFLDPAPVNHIYLPPCHYQVHDCVIYRDAQCRGFVNGLVVQQASAANDYLAHVKQRQALPKEVSPTNELALEPADAELAQDGAEVAAMHLTHCNSSIAMMSAAAFEEEVHKLKVYYKARHSSINDALSGMRLDVKECAMPTLYRSNKILSTGVMRSSSTANTSGSVVEARGSGNKQNLSRMPTLSHAISTSTLPNNPESLQIDKNGWTLVKETLERFERGASSCQPLAFLILGSPGSGKSCLICRLILDAVERERNIVPLLIPISELVKRSGRHMEGELLGSWFDKYLQMTYGEDSLRYRAICQGIRMHRVMFLFEGLEDAGGLSSTVERCILDLVLDRHLVFITSRPFVSKSSLENADEHIITLQLQNLNDEQRRAIAHSRLGLEGLRAYDKFFKQLKEKSRVGGSDLPEEDNATDQNEEQEDVFGNPMMLSMLICYLQGRQRENEEVPAQPQQTSGALRGDSIVGGDDDAEGVTLTAVYKVAIDVMLHRVQSKQQAERHKKEEKVETCNQILRKMAMQMQIQQSTVIEAKEVEGFLTNQDMKKEWLALKSSIQSGHAMFLRMSQEHGRTELRFLVKGLQNFFAASEIAHDGIMNLPPLVPLLTEPWWAQMLEMLAEAWPHRYVLLIEAKLEQFTPVKGDSFLHIAARVGHGPVFQLLRLFKQHHQTALWSRDLGMQTPLHVAAVKGHTQLCGLMLEQKASLETEDSAGCLAMHVAMTHGHFTTAKYLLERWEEVHQGKSNVSISNMGQANQLADRVLNSQLSEEDFLEAVHETFVELRFFGKDDLVPKKQELGALLAVYWICANHYEQFVRGQSMETRLTQSSWDKLQDWTRQIGGLTNDNALLGAMLVYVAIINVGKIMQFRKAFAPDFDDPNEALAHVLQTAPILIPSFSRLDAKLQQVMLKAVNAEFNFGQFLQAENLPASLFIVKGILVGGTQGSVNVLGFFLFRIFAAMSGLFGDKGLDGSRFMIDKNYTNFKVGLDVMGHLVEESAQQVYGRFLRERSKGQGLKYAEDPESRARVRMACLARVFDSNGGKEVSDAFDKLESTERAELIRFLNTDGIQERPGFLLYKAPDFVNVSQHRLGLVHAMRMLLKVYQACEKEYQGSELAVVNIFLDELTDFAKRPTTNEEVFAFTKFEITRSAGRKADSQGSVKISPWQLVADKDTHDKLVEEGDKLTFETMQMSVREPVFLTRIHKVFPELRYFVGEHNSDLLRQTKCALLFLYWLVSDSAEAMRRGQASAEKLSDKSWTAITSLLRPSEDHEDHEDTALRDFYNALFVALAIHAVGKVPKFQEQLAPDALSHKQVLQHVMDNAMLALPSYARLDPADRTLVRDCLTHNFDFEQFLHGENLPANLTTIKEMLQRPDNVGGCEKYLVFFQFITLGELSASMGAESCEGSLYLTEDRWSLCQVGMSVMEGLTTRGATEQDIYNAYLRRQAQTCELDFQPTDPESRAVVRLACLSRAFSAGKGGAKKAAAEVQGAVEELTSKERATLVKYLNADGIKEKPGFILDDATSFLENAWHNKEVGLLPAMRILLRVYAAAEQEFNGTSEPILRIKLGKLRESAKDFRGSVAFQDMPFELVRLNAVEALAIPKAWIPVTNAAVLGQLKKQAELLSEDLLNVRVSEGAFKDRIGRIFPELSYFTDSSLVYFDRTICSMLSVFWLITDRHDAFIRSQPEEEQLSRQSWAWIKEWMDQTVKLSSVEAVDATLVFMAVHALGKVREFREELARGFDEHTHDLALAHILETKPQVVPSFSRLSQKYKDLVVDSLSVDFEFSQFLQAENLPANLVVVKEKLKRHGDDGFAFFCFRIFGQMCGKLGAKSLKGSLFMTEPQFQCFRPGLDALQQLRTLDAEAAYEAFLRYRVSKALSRFASAEHQALARLLCLGSAFDYRGGDEVCEAFDRMPPSSRAALTKWLTSDGINVRPGYVLCHVPTMLHNAKANEAVGLIAAFQMLLNVQELCERTVPKHTAKVVVNFAELADWAKEAGPDPGDFMKATPKLRMESQTETRVYWVTVERPSESERRRSRGDRGAEGMLSRWLRCFFYFLLIVLFLMSSAGLAYSVLRPASCRHLWRRIHFSEEHGFYALCGVSGFSLLLLCGACLMNRCSADYAYREVPTTAAGLGQPASKTLSPVLVGGDGGVPLLSRRGYSRLKAVENASDNDEAV